MLDYVHRRRTINLVITGKCRGTDAHVEAWAHSRGILFKGYPADWDAHGLAAGPNRTR